MLNLHVLWAWLKKGVVNNSCSSEVHYHPSPGKKREMAQRKVTWLPLEANPDVMNKYIMTLGLKPTHLFYDVFGLDADLLPMIPTPCVALVMLFPITDKYESFKNTEEGRLKKDGQAVSQNLFYMKQFVGNACGTIGMLHALGNNTGALEFNDGFLKKMFEATKTMSPEERGKYLEEDEDISVAHEESAQEGDTAPPQDGTNYHFVALVEKDGSLYELDGRKAFPINHGPTTPDNFLNDAAKVCQDFMKRDPNEIHFNILAFSKVQ